MNKKNVIKKGIFALAIISLIIVGCKKKDKKEEVDNDTQSSSDNALAESSFNDVTSIADQANEGALSTFRVASTDGLLSNCASIVRLHADSTNADTLIITFGFNGINPAANCLCNDGRYRRGIINVIYTGKYRDSLSTHTISFTNYFVNDNQILGTKTVKNIGRNAAGHPVFTITVNGSVILANGGGTVTWTSNRTREWIAGYTTFGPGNWNDDVYLISGSASGTSSSGNSFTASITSPLKRALSCRWFESGTFEFTPSGKPTRTVDFGNGGCDDQATVTINGTAHTITLH